MAPVPVLYRQSRRHARAGVINIVSARQIDRCGDLRFTVAEDDLGMLLVAQVNHQHVVVYINMQMFFYLFALTDEKGGRYGGCVPAGALYIPVKYPKSADDRMADEASAAKCIDDTMKMQGAVLDSPLIINAMEEDCRGRFIPVTFKKDGTVSAKSSVINSDTMEKIKALAIKQIEDMGRAVYSGDFPASPLESKKYKCTIPCGFCDYREICGNYPDPVPRDISDIDFEINGEKE